MAAKKKRRCDGTVVKNVRGTNRNERCTRSARVERVVQGAQPATFNFCEKCAQDFDAQRSFMGLMGL